MPNEEVSRKKAALRLYKTGCLSCWLQTGKMCQFGTVGGDCIPCGKYVQSGEPLKPFDRFFTKDVFAYMLSLAAKHDCQPLGSEEDFLEFKTTTPTGSNNSHTIQLRGEDLFNNSLPLGQIITSHYVPSIRYRAATTTLVKTSLRVRGYLSLLLPCNAVKETTTFSNAFNLSSLILSGLDEDISGIVNAASKEKNQGGEAFWSEVTVAVAIIFTGLRDAQKGLEDGNVIPLCGDTTLVDFLKDRIEFALQHLDRLLHGRSINCDPSWPWALDGPLDCLRSNIKILTVDIRTPKKVGRASSSLLSVETSNFPSPTSPNILPSTNENSFEDFGTMTSYMPISNGWFETGPPSPSAPYTETSSSHEDEPRTPINFTFKPSSSNDSEKYDLLSPSSLPFGNMAANSRKRTRNMTSQDTMLAYSEPCNIAKQPKIRGANPGPTFMNNNNNLRPPKRSRGSNFLPQMPNPVPMTGASYRPDKASGDMASQVSEPLGPILWTT